MGTEQTTGTARPLVLGGRYELSRSLPADAAGTERWRARDTILQRDVEALVLTTALPEVLDAARRASLVDDHRLAHVLDVGGFYVVTDVVSGPDLGELAGRGPLPAAQARAIVGECASALETARRHGVRHLALGPGSVHVTPDGQVLVTGLGTDAALLGSADPDADPLAADRRDAGDLVRLLYLALTGTWPTGEGVRPPRELRPDVPAELDDLCVRTLLEGNGPRSTGELIRELAPWRDVDPAALRPAPAVPAFTPVRGTRTTAVVADPDDAPAEDPQDASAAPPAPVGPGSPSPTRPDPPTTSAPPPPPPPAHDEAPQGGIVTAPRESISWSPRRPGTAAAPGFTDIVGGTGEDRDAPHPARHSRMTGALVGLGVVAGSAARAAAATVAEQGRRAADTTRRGASTAGARLGPLATQARTGLGTAVTTGRDRVAARAGARTDPAERYSDVDGPEVPFPERRINPTPVVLVAFAALVLVLFLLSVRTLLAPPEEVTIPDVGPAATAQATPEATAAPEPTTEAPPPEPPAATPVIASLAPLDPQGDGAENPELTPRATDGDPATFWRSRSYVNPEYGMKEGIGLAVTLQGNATVSRVEIDLRGTGGLVQIRATDPSTPTEGEVLAEGEMGPGSVFTFAEPVETDKLVLWFPRLPVAESDGRNRIELGELRVG